MKKIPLLFWAVQIWFPVLAQTPVCGNDFFYKDSISMLQSLAYEKQIAAYLAHNNAAGRSEIVIPVVVHILWHTPPENLSDGLILSQITALNKDFNAENSDIENVPDEFKPVIGATGIRFCLATVDPQGKQTNGITRRWVDTVAIGLTDKLYYSARGGEDAWDTERYLNIWVADLGAHLAGFATTPNQSIPEKMGVIINFKYFGINGHPKYGLGRSATHEIGHFFGLKHTWGDDTQCDTDDEVADTPLQQNAYSGCPAYPQSSCSPSEMFMNFMDYVNDPCMFLFTEGQKQRMLATLALYRPGLIDSGIPCLGPPINTEINVSIYPNPSAGLFTVSCAPAAMRIIKYSIHNSIGRFIEQQEIVVNETIMLDLSNYPNGIYILNIDGNAYKLVKL